MNPRPTALPERSPVAWRFMTAWFARFFRKHLNALHVARWGRPTIGAHAGPLVIYCNHPSWWDAATVIVMADHVTPKHVGYAPFDAAMLERYGIFRKLGAFPVDLGSARGAAQFLAASRAILSRADSALWITAQGRFADVRARPLGLKPGIARLAEIAPDALFVPLALEYAFWEERGAEAFCAFGEPMRASDLAALPRPRRLARLEDALSATLDGLSRDVIARDPARFEALAAGRKGIGGIYDLWRRLRAALGGARFDPAHRSEQGAQGPR